MKVSDTCGPGQAACWLWELQQSSNSIGYYTEPYVKEKKAREILLYWKEIIIAQIISRILL